MRSSTRMTEAIAAAVVQRDERKALGFDQAALDLASKLGFAEGVSEESAEEVGEVIEEFFPEKGEIAPHAINPVDTGNKASLQVKLGERAKGLRLQGSR